MFCDFGPSFTVVDKNGETLQDCMIQSITNEEEGLVTCLKGIKHGYEDGDAVMITEVKGMKLKDGEKHEDPELKSETINGTLHKVKTVNASSFKIGDTRKFEEYVGNGIAKQLKTNVIKKFKTFPDIMLKTHEELLFDEDLRYADFSKLNNATLSHVAFEALDKFNASNGAMDDQEETKEDKVDTCRVRIRSWNRPDAEKFIEIAKDIAKRYDLQSDEWKDDGYELKFLYLFAF